MNKPVHAIIVDDEKRGRDLLKILISEHCPHVHVSGIASNIRQAQKMIESLKPDLVFLDIEMPGGSGFDLLEKYTDVPFSVIFVSAYNKYAMKAFKFSAVDYLLKPVDEQELVKAVEKASKHDRENTGPALETFTQNYRSLRQGHNRLALSTREGLAFIEIADITRCKADGKYTWIYLKEKKEILATKNLGEFEDFLSEHNFIRVHHAHLVNLDYIKSYHPGRSGIITMQDNSEVDVSQRKKDEFLKRLNKI